MRSSGHGLLYILRFLITVSILLLVIICLYFLFPPGSVLEGCIAAGVRTEGWDELGDWDRHVYVVQSLSLV